MQLAQAALTSAIAQDLFSWLALALILNLAKDHGSHTSPLITRMSRVAWNFGGGPV